MGKADLFIQGVRAKSYDPEKVALGLMALSAVFFSDRHLMLEPDCSQWTQDVNDDQEAFDKRCDALMFLTSGDPRAGWWHLQPLDLEERVSLVKEILTYQLYSVLFAGGKDMPFSQFYDDPKGLVKCWDTYFETESGFEHADDIVHHICSNEDVHEVGSEFLQLGEQADLGDWQEVDSRFYDFITKVKEVEPFGWGAAFDSDDVNKPVSLGGSGRVVDYEFERDGEYDVGFVILSPFPGIRASEEASERFKTYCSDFNRVERSRWFTSYWSDSACAQLSSK